MKCSISVNTNPIIQEPWHTLGIISQSATGMSGVDRRLSAASFTGECRAAFREVLVYVV